MGKEALKVLIHDITLVIFTIVVDKLAMYKWFSMGHSMADLRHTSHWHGHWDAWMRNINNILCICIYIYRICDFIWYYHLHHIIHIDIDGVTSLMPMLDPKPRQVPEKDPWIDRREIDWLILAFALPKWQMPHFCRLAEFVRTFFWFNRWLNSMSKGPPAPNHAPKSVKVLVDGNPWAATYL